MITGDKEVLGEGESIRTRVCDLLEIEYPVLQGGMAWVSTAELVAAVSEGGGLGIIGSGQAPPDWVREQVRKTKALTGRPFGVNVMLLSPYASEIMELLVEEKVAVVTTGAGNPGKFVELLHSAGVKVIPVVSSVALAKRLARSGVDALIAEGMESGGHIGDLTTMALVPQIVDAVELPVIAAGGIFDGRGMAAAIMLGAEGVQMGTRFMCAAECTIHARVKDMVIKAKDRDTIVTGRPTGHPVRVLKNKLARQFLELEERCAGGEEFERLGAGRLKLAMQDGDVEMGSVMAGQVSSMVKKIQPARDIITEVVTGAEQAIKGAYSRAVS
ncbi:enoyl-[acyl-carrier-protein] reductase FabK [Desulfotruncus alcoholivorax]|uniref:enoyl-[acyl-carrier-protein] reductase FabK n=1 Tax=Desulfotruncus alcoholivorax TaxID=265477 RepID=UPI000414019B|nr:enoyl-[acyl-carrier-protein] reductase FabK [Desulfotruncus alcoholivorax]